MRGDCRQSELEDRSNLACDLIDLVLSQYVFPGRKWCQDALLSCQWARREERGTGGHLDSFVLCAASPSRRGCDQAQPGSCHWLVDQKRSEQRWAISLVMLEELRRPIPGSLRHQLACSPAGAGMRFHDSQCLSEPPPRLTTKQTASFSQERQMNAATTGCVRHDEPIIPMTGVTEA
ncbi:hypothetical protein K505DRAFT_36771 [Melanomma pulvis-pyrius CBS 109.77]|uniref:Uncharacterized protein n=1 Tax=Melanomma pulvis-pyrius CBS 109.77 TaxID=1314802 RepID=A0A6A6XW43_9PLEO|nr:hypothetical protein K505DRAFT_36771 [Melanomma pulvis-pyrius CBS 109.77]